MIFLTILGVTEKLCSFRLVLEEKTGKEIHQSSRSEFLEKLLGNNFVLKDAVDNTSRPSNRGGITDLPLLRKFLGKEGSLTTSYASLATSGTFLQQLLACLNFTLDSEDLVCWYK